MKWIEAAGGFSMLFSSEATLWFTLSFRLTVRNAIGGNVILTAAINICSLNRFVHILIHDFSCYATYR